VTDFHGIPAGTIPGLAEAGGRFMSVRGLPARTARNMVKFIDELRGMQSKTAGVRGVRTARRFHDRGPAPQGGSY
jgi:hypothetical protein